ncbi:hypothetical protein ACFCZ6_38040 [Streptomyces hydrogenans]|uniref:hypothetical protein n=1 Tax=Streptomyces hydrogenans TaxID=1873719 RepID=UPI0035D6FD32
MKHKRATLTALAATAVLTTAGAAWYTTLDTPAGTGPSATAHGLCLPATETDADKAGYARTIALVTVEKTVEYREGSSDPGGVLISRVKVDQTLKGTPAETLTIGQSVLPVASGGYAKTKPAYLPLEAGHQYVIGTVPDTDYGDGWVRFVTSADTDTTAAVQRWTTAVAQEAAPHPNPACTDTTTTNTTP